MHAERPAFGLQPPPRFRQEDSLVDTQQLVTVAVILAAVGYLVRRTWLRLSARRTSSCGSCSGCAAVANGQRLPTMPLIRRDAEGAAAGSAAGATKRASAPGAGPEPAEPASCPRAGARQIQSPGESEDAPA